MRRTTPPLRHVAMWAVGVMMLQASTPATAAAVSGGRTTEIAPQRSRVTQESYILGPGYSLNIELLDIPELSGTFSIGPDGTIYLPRLRALQVEGLTVEELRYFLTDQYKIYVKSPQVFINPVGYRAVRVYVGGEIYRPGYYMISGGQVIQDPLNIREGTSPNRFRSLSSSLNNFESAQLRLQNSAPDDVTTFQGISSSPNRWPTLFDALRAAQGVTPFSDLAAVKVIRKQPISQGGGKAQAQVNFLSLVTEGDESVNIRLFDGDVVKVGRSDELLRDQLLAASRTNLSPDFIEVFVSGRVNEPGPQSLPQGATLNQAIASAGGARLLRGGIEFLRFNPDGQTDRRLFTYNPSAKSGDFKNPVLMRGDVVRVNNSLISAGLEVVNEVTGPAVGIYSVYSIFKPLFKP